MSTTTIRVDHLARVEGHGGITVELDGAQVGDVRFDVFEGPRLLEGLLRGRRYDEVAPFVSRICAICSAAHLLTSLKATEAAFGIRPSARTELLRELLFRGESIESHALHVFLLALPDYLGYPSATFMAAEHAEAVRLGLRLKALGNQVQEALGGRAIHLVNPVPGGFASPPAEPALIALRDALRKGVEDVNAALDLLTWLPPLEVCRAETTYAALEAPDGTGYYAGDVVVIRGPGGERRIPAADYRRLTSERTVPHSYARHSSFDGAPFMVGALARLALRRPALPARAVAALGRIGLDLPSDDPLDNNRAQVVELAMDVDWTLAAVERLLDEGPRTEPPPPVRPRAGTGTAITEAPRGLLVHSYTYDENGVVTAADVITPTAINAASLERHLRISVEQAEDRETAPLKRRLEMLARAYDPCISCSVHVVRGGDGA